MQAEADGNTAVKEVSRLFAEIHNPSKAAVAMVKDIDLMTREQAGAGDRMAETMAAVRESARRSSPAAARLQESVRSINQLTRWRELHRSDQDLQP